MFIRILLLLTAAGTISCSKDYENIHYDTVIVSQKGGVESLDPILARNRNELQIVSQIYETLYQFDFSKKNIRISPLLAADLPSWSKNRLKLTIRLKKNVFFQEDDAFLSSGSRKRSLTAHDFVYSIKRLGLKNPNSPILQLLAMRILGFRDFIDNLQNSAEEEKAIAFEKNIKGLTATDHQTIVIRLSRPMPDFAYLLTHPSTTPIAREIVENYANESGYLTKKAIGTGPFILRQFKPGAEIILEKNKKYHSEFFPMKTKAPFNHYAGKPLPLIDYIVFRHLKSHTPEWMLFKKAKIDWIELSLSEIEKMKSSGLPIMSSTAPDLYYLGFNLEDPLLRGNQNLRRAIYHAINRKEFLAFFGSKKDQSLSSLFQKSTLKADPYNKKTARHFLKKAGFPNGNGLQTLRLDIPADHRKARQIGAFISKELSKIGIELEVHYLTLPRFEEKRKAQKLQMFYHGWTPDSPIAASYYQILHSRGIQSGINLTRINDREADQLLDQMLSRPSVSRSKEINQMDHLISNFAPIVPLFAHYPKYAIQPWIKNFTNSLWFYPRYKYVAIDKELKEKLH